MIDPTKIDTAIVADQLHKHENEWVAISEDNQIVANGLTYGETLKKVARADEVILLKVPPLNYSLAPQGK